MLVILSQYTRVHHIAPQRGFTRVDWHGANYPGCSGLDSQSPSLVKVISKDVFIIS